MNTKLSVFAIAIAAALTGCNSSDDDFKDRDPIEPPPVEPPAPTVVVTLAQDASSSEPSSGTSQMKVRLTLDSATEQPTPIHVKTEDGSATSSGPHAIYNAIDSVMTIPEGTRSFDIPVTIRNNNTYEGLTQFTLRVAEPTDSDINIEFTNDIALISISDTDRIPKIEFADDFQTVVEGSSTLLELNLSHYTSNDVEVRLKPSGTASDADYTIEAEDFTLTIPALSLTTSTRIHIIDDQLPEGGESLIFNFDTLDGAEPGDVDEYTIFIPGYLGLNDTGFNTYFDGVNFDSTKPNPEYPNQDADYGFDNSGELTAAHAGFKFIKLDSNGNTLPDTATDFTCVKDVRTGLFIEAKLPGNSSLFSWQKAKSIYSWYESNKTINGGVAGTEGHRMELDPEMPDFAYSSECQYYRPADGSKTPQYCNTETYIGALNSESLCGVNDWRMPSPGELRSLYNYGVKIDEEAVDYFPNLNEAAYLHSGSTALNNKGSAWCLNVSKGQIQLCHKSLGAGIIAVRKGAQ